MNMNRKSFLFVTSMIIALAAGFGLAQIFDGGSERPPPLSQGADDGHDDEAHDGVVALTVRQIEAAGIRIVAVGRGGGSETRLAGRVEYTLEARTAIATSVGGRVERVHVAPGSDVEAGQALAEVISGAAA